MSNRAIPALFLASLTAAPAVQLKAQAQGPPATAVGAVTDTLFGTVVADPYRWLENLQDSTVIRWFHAQQDYTRRVLDRIPGRAALGAEVHELSNAVQTVDQVWVGGRRVFYLQRLPGEDVSKLYVRDSLEASERLLVDPERLRRPEGPPWAIDYFAPSPDGRYVAYGVSEGGSENSVLRVVDATSGSTLADSITRTQIAGVSWRPDGHSFFYNRMQAVPPGGADTERYRNSRAYLHVVGRPDTADVAVLGTGVSPQVRILPDDFPFVVVIPGSDWALAEIVHGVANEITVYAAPIATVHDGTASWRPVVDVVDSVTQVAGHGDDIYLLAHAGAPRYRVLRTSARAPDIAHADVVAPEGEAVIRAIGVARDALYIQLLDGGVARLERLGFAGGSTAEPIALPYDGGISTYPFTQGLVTSGDRSGALVLLESWTHSRRWYRFDPQTGSLRDTRLLAPSPVDFSAVESEEVRVPGRDGTLVPLSIVHPRGLPRDGSHPTLLVGYGAYGISLDPTFRPYYRAWFDRGGVLAICHVRGGGEFGEAWHQGGRGPSKSNTWRDFISCAQYLVRERWTSAARLAGMGGSAGGILIGMAVDERPDLFRAAVAVVGDMNPVRSMLVGETGPANRPEFGDPTMAEGFRELLAMDAYTHFRPGTPYPAMLFTTGFNDPRVDPWVPAKMTARVQSGTTSGRPVLLRVDFGAGHGISSAASQDAELRSDIFAFLLWQFGVEGFQPQTP